RPVREYLPSLEGLKHTRLRLAPSTLRFLTLLVMAALVSVTPLRTLAEGEATILLPIADNFPATLPDPQAEPLAATGSLSSSEDSEPVAAAPQAIAAATEEVAEPTATIPAPTATEPAAVPSATPTRAPSPTPNTPAAGTHVAIEGSNYQYTLRVNGRLMVVRGMGYNPWYAKLPVDERRALYRRDFSAMREVGINTVEGWFQDQFDEVTLDEAQRQGLKVIMPYELNQDYDYADPATKQRFREEVTAWVKRYKDHPAVLMWGPGNEVMHRLIFPTAVQGLRDPGREQRADAFAAFYVELMDVIHEVDPTHPVVYRDAEDLYFARLREQLLKGQVRRPWFIYGTNVYTSRIAEVIERWPTQGLDAPLLVSEFSPGGVGEQDRPRMLGWYWSTIRAHPERVLGGVVYTWATRGPEDLDRVFGLTDDNGAPVDGSLGALRQLFHEDVVGRREGR
ncbi:MAG: glycoside hydrolase family 2 TIM barrel-domain containing protein, partial [Chloroflexota bacterium]